MNVGGIIGQFLFPKPTN